MKVVIVAGGKGSRLENLTQAVPKPMIRIAKKPILEYQILLAKRYNLKEIIILLGYKGEAIENYFEDGKRWAVNIHYNRENIQLGTSGAMREIENLLQNDFLVFYGDIMLDVDLESLISFHSARKPIATTVVHPNNHPHDSDLVELDEDNRVAAFHNKPHKEGTYFRNLVNAGLYILSPRILKHIPRGVYSDFAKDIFPKLIALDEPICAYNTPEYIKDIGTLERLKEAEIDVASGRVTRLNRGNKRKAVLMDRDGVLNCEVDSLRNPEELKLLPGVPDAVRRLNESGYLSVIITNQPVIAKGFATEKGLNRIHSKLETLLGTNRAYLDRIYYCPHHPDKGFEGERQEYKIECSCRKPKIGMVEKAVNELNIAIEDSFLVGDRTVDIMTGINAGLKTILVRTGYAGDDGKFQCVPDFVFEDLKEAVDFILGTYDDLLSKIDSLICDESLISKDNPVIVVSGLSRSGKSVLARVISIVLGKRGIASKILPLDHWIVDINERKDWMGVRQRYNYHGIVADLQALLDGKEIKLSKYDVKKRTVRGQLGPFSLNKEEILIVDGIVGLDIEHLREITDFKIYVDVPEDIRKRRFYNFYRYKGMSEEDIEELYLQRQNDETPIVVGTKKYADYVIKMAALR